MNKYFYEWQANYLPPCHDTLLIWQLDEFCSKMKAYPELAGGVNVVGYSQGGLLVRAYVERCNDPPVKNLLSYLGPQMGVYGVPRVNACCFSFSGLNSETSSSLWSLSGLSQICWVPYINTTLDTLVGTFIYSEWAQHLFSFAGYWRGLPPHLTLYPTKLRDMHVSQILTAC